ncbi:MAG: phospholipase D-like domain-containing protein [archaeon]
MKTTTFILLAGVLLLGVFFLLILPRTKTIPKENGSISIYFCPRDACEEHVLAVLAGGESVQCALYDIRLERIQSMLVAVHAAVLTDEDTAKYFSYATPIAHEGLMHDKFCVVNHSIVITGSWNPTASGTTKNDENILILHSAAIAERYLDEFTALWQAT